jgi:hypothetical protein
MDFIKRCYLKFCEQANSAVGFESKLAFIFEKNTFYKTTKKIRSENSKRIFLKVSFKIQRSNLLRRQLRIHATPTKI